MGLVAQGQVATGAVGPRVFAGMCGLWEHRDPLQHLEHPRAAPGGVSPRSLHLPAHVGAALLLSGAWGMRLLICCWGEGAPEPWPWRELDRGQGCCSRSSVGQAREEGPSSPNGS